MVKIIKSAPTCFDSHKTVIREPLQVPSEIYVSGTNAPVVIDVNVMTAYVAITLTHKLFDIIDARCNHEKKIIIVTIFIKF